MSAATAKRYAKTIFKVANEANQLDAIASELKALKDLLEKSKGLQDLFSNPVISSNQRVSLLGEIFKNKVSPQLFGFLLLLERKNRLNILSLIIDEFELLFFDKRQIARVKISTPFPVSSDQIQSITQYLQTKLRKKIEPHVEIEKSLLGGLKVQVGDVVYDYSLRTQLDRFKKQLLTA